MSNFMIKGRYEGGNAGHWLAEPLEPGTLRALRRYEDGAWHTPPGGDFEVAYLIARECLEFDADNGVRITAKGLDALDWFEAGAERRAGKGE